MVGITEAEIHTAGVFTSVLYYFRRYIKKSTAGFIPLFLGRKNLSSPTADFLRSYTDYVVGPSKNRAIEPGLRKQLKLTVHVTNYGKKKLLINL